MARPRGRPKKIKEDTEGIVKVEAPEVPLMAKKSEKEELLELMELLKSKNIRSMSDLELMIAHAEG